MHKVTTALLLIPIIFSSCSIDWNDEKEKRIAELKSQIESINVEASRLEFEKKKYEEEKAINKKETIEKYKSQCAKNQDKLTNNIVNMLNSCTTKLCQDTLMADPRLKIPSNYIENCVQKKMDGTWMSE